MKLIQLNLRTGVQERMGIVRLHYDTIKHYKRPEAVRQWSTKVCASDNALVFSPRMTSKLDFLRAIYFPSETPQKPQVAVCISQVGRQTQCAQFSSMVAKPRTCLHVVSESTCRESVSATTGGFLNVVGRVAWN